MARPDGRIEPGQSLKTALSATAWNRAQDAADIVLGARTSVVGGGATAGSVPYTWCYAKNNTGVTVPRWGVLGIGGLEIEPSLTPGGATAQFEQMPVLSGNMPTEGAIGWTVAVEPIVADSVGKVAVAGVVQCKVSITSETDNFAGSGDSVSELKTGTAGEGQILWKQSGTGSNKWALIRIGGGAPKEEIRFGGYAGAWSRGTEKSVTTSAGIVLANNLLCNIPDSGQPTRACVVVLTPDGWQLVNFQMDVGGAVNTVELEGDALVFETILSLAVGTTGQTTRIPVTECQQ
jgi:hypothetical protein